jgi:hypothetical protein
MEWTPVRISKINVTILCVQTADDLEPLVENMDATVGVSTQTLVSTDGPQQVASKLPQYAAAVSGNVRNKNVFQITCLRISGMN